MPFLAMFLKENYYFVYALTTKNKENCSFLQKKIKKENRLVNYLFSSSFCKSSGSSEKVVLHFGNLLQA